LARVPLGVTGWGAVAAAPATPDRARPLRVLHAAAEGLPFVKTGGLADVAAALPRALSRLGVSSTVVLPAHRPALPGAPEARDTGRRVAGQPGAPAPEGGFEVLEAAVEDVRWLLLDHPALFHREGPYLDRQGREWPDNAFRYAAFAAAVAELAAAEGADLVHAHDWPAALIPVYEELRRARLGGPRRFATVLTIHNVAYQGWFPASAWPTLGFPEAWFGPEGLEFYGGVNFLKGGILFADALTTVSPTYAGEIVTREGGAGLDGVLAGRRNRLRGILNGIDDETWDPRRDPHLARRYGVEDAAEGKAACRAALRRELGLALDPAPPLAAVVARVAEQKGVDLLLGAVPAFLPDRVQLAVLASGEPRWEGALLGLASAHPGRVAVRVGVDLALAHRIEAGAHLFLMPSRFEPCGLNQMYSQRYGTIPVVRRTGGLADTVVDAAEPDGTGYVFRDANVGGLAWALDRALRDAGTPVWDALRRRGMTRDFSWRRSARDYLELYRSLAPQAGAVGSEER
jgi:starch synthase